MTAHALTSLSAGQLIPFGGDRVVAVPDDLASVFSAGDRLVVVQDTGDLLHIPIAEHEVVSDAVGAAVRAFAQLASVADEQVTAFFDDFAEKLDDDASFAPIAEANEADVASARERGRSTTRLVLSASMRRAMIDGLRVWRDAPSDRKRVTETIAHDGWTVTARRAPLGVVGFVFEGRPNVFADATGVLRTGNTGALRIGSDALGTARAIMQHALWPALRECGLPEGAITLIDSPSRASGWALFSDRRLALAVARGSGTAVAQLGAVARQSGVPVSLHGTGGAWMVASHHADRDEFRQAVLHSLDRKVCNTLNVCCIVADRAEELVPVFVSAVREAAASRAEAGRVHVTQAASPFAEQSWFDEGFADVIDDERLGDEWEWENCPEVALAVVGSVHDAVELFNLHSPRLAVSLIGSDDGEQSWFYDVVDAPFVGNGMTRWVDGQFALDRPELGLSNWEGGRLLARSAVLSGDSVYTVRLTAHVTDSSLRR